MRDCEIIKLSRIFNSRENQEYIAACKEIKEYYRSNTIVPAVTTKRYKKALENYRNYLDAMNIRLPVIKYPIIKTDPNTYRYSDAVLKELDTHTQYIRMVENPNWIYKKKPNLVNVVV